MKHNSAKSKFDCEKINKNDLASIKILARQVFQEYLNNTNAWRHINIGDFEIERISGGLSNYLYKCEITKREAFKPVQNEPDTLLFR
jgi:hypothetical protein